MKRLVKIISLLLAVLLAASGCALLEKVGIGSGSGPTEAPVPLQRANGSAH